MIIKRKFISLTAACIGLLGISSAAVAGGGVFQIAEVNDLTGEGIIGGANAIRKGDSVHVRVAVSGLPPYSVFSAWFLVWNDPGNCKGPGVAGGFCLPPGDGGGMDPPDAVRNAAGFLTGADGTASFSAWLDVGALPKGFPGFGRLEKGKKSEIHVVIDSHTTAVLGSIGRQISTPCGSNADVPEVCGGVVAGIVFPPAN